MQRHGGIDGDEPGALEVQPVGDTGGQRVHARLRWPRVKPSMVVVVVAVPLYEGQNMTAARDGRNSSETGQLRFLFTSATATVVGLAQRSRVM